MGWQSDTGEQVGDARLIVRENALEVRERLRRDVARTGDDSLSPKSDRAMRATRPRRIAARGLGGNRIGMKQTSRDASRKERGANTPEFETTLPIRT